jgi:Uma2 family endonuclease
MTAAAESLKSAPVAEQRIVLRSVGWDGYQSLLELIGDQAIRLTYDRGDVELTAPQPIHERKKSLPGQYVRILARELHIPIMPMGSATWNRQDLDRGLEADESFYLGDLDRVADPDHIDLTIDPPPDLAVEIEISPSTLERMSIYGALGVPELWRYNGRALKVLIRQEDGSYRVSDRSAILPEIPIDEINRFANLEESRDENINLDQFSAWVRALLESRKRGASS